jgi:hypothetical protein
MHGRLLHKAGDKRKDFCDLDLSEAVFAEMPLQGARCSVSNLTSADFHGADLYWSSFFMANLTVANFERAQLKGVTSNWPTSPTPTLGMRIWVAIRLAGQPKFKEQTSQARNFEEPR